LAIAGEIHIHASIRKDKPVIAGEAIEHLRKSLVPFHIAGTLEKLIQGRLYNVL